MPDQTPAVGMERKLAAIFSTDVAGYSRLMGDDEAATIRTLTAYREVMTTLIQRHRGRVVDSPGDNLLAEFASAVDAVLGAVEIQRELKVKNADLPDARKMEYRIGINVGDVVVEGERLYGDGVNIAARLESLALPGGICISGTAYDQVKNKVALGYEYLGEREVKNIAEPVRVYQVKIDGETGPTVGAARRGRPQDGQPQRVAPTPTPTQVRKIRPAYRWVVAGLVLLTVTLGVIRYFSRPPLSTQSSALMTDAAPAALPLPDKPSLIVLPFVNMSEDPKQDYFSDGLTEVLTGDLSKISSLFVIARNTAFTYKGKAVNVQEAGHEMGVRYVLEGSVQKADQQVRIAVQLIEATTGYHLWSEQYDRPLKDIFALQDEIVQKIGTTLKLQLTLQEQGLIVRKHTHNLEAYDDYLRGVESFNRYTKESNAQARQLFEKAIALDSQYAEAYTSLGWTYRNAWVWGWSTDPQTEERARALVQQALALDDSLPKAHSLLSWLYAEQHQSDQAITEGERAIALDPNNADSYAAQADVLNLAGRPEDALRSVEQAMRLSPRYPPWYLFESGMAYSATGRYAEAIAALKDAVNRNPNLILAYLQLTISYGRQWLARQSPASQTLELAMAAGQQAVVLNGSLPWAHLVLGGVYLYQGQHEQALVELEQAVALAPADADNSALRAEVLSCVGRSEDALEAAAQALRLKPFVTDAHLISVGAAYAVAGHYEEARAPLQRYLSRYPNILPAHLLLAAVYSELGHPAEAQKEAAEVLRLNPQFSLEVHRQRMPIKDPAVLERHIAALRKAGLK